ncbi:multidrug efflux pump subunit AcrB [Paenibacillus cellulosilyticus]|uniref:Multidrug efflux pump subunit AcrB n=1 Tax=Paenibacillus cellulosilyticus TaxID=375489 RepID=A0A2V2Z054_9BACL|nr:multidrug efflux pump subunit AcrB [Paenibacillus cellulosilyticus]
MKGIIGFSMNKVAAMLILIVILIGGGLYSANSLKMENIPDVSMPYVIISTTYSASPQDVMTEVTKPIEDKVSNIEGLDTMSSTSSDTGSTVMIQFSTDVDVDKKKSDLESLIQTVSLPTDASRPVVSTFGFASIPAYYLAVYADEGMTQTDLDNLFQEELKPGFESIDGVDHIDSIGARETSLDIKLNANTLNAFGMTPSDVTNAIRSALTSGSAGMIKVDGNDQVVRITGELNSVYSLNHLELTTSDGQTLLLQEVAEVQAINDSEFISRVDGKPAIGINLYKTTETNAVDFSNDTNALIEKWEKSNPSLTFKVIYDSSDTVRESISGLLREGLIGVALAALIILLFLRNIRMTAIVLVSIPLSILITLIAMNYLDITLNIMSLGGMFIAVGRIVDDSIVVIENIFTNLQNAQKRGQSVILMAAQQVAMAISSSTFVTVGVFLPIAFVSGIVGDLFRPFAVTVAVALLSSLLVALTVIPLMAKMMVLRSFKSGGHDENATGKITSFYGRILGWCLNHKFRTLLLSAVLFIVTLVGTIPNLSINFISEDDSETQMSFTVKLPYETTLESTDEETKRIEEMFNEAKDESGKPIFTFVESLIGYSGSDEQAPYAVTINTEVTDKVDPAAIKEEYTNKILADIPKGSEVTPGSLSGGGGGLSTTDFSYSLNGDDQDLLEQATELVKDKLKEFPELKDVEDSLGDAKMQIDVSVSQPKAKQFGLSVDSILNTVRGWINDTDLGDIRIDGELYSTTVKLSEEDKNSIEKLAQLPLRSATGDIVYLNEVASIKKVEAPVSLARTDQKQIVTITASIESSNKSAVSNKISMALSQLQLPEGVSTSVGGVNADIGDSFSQLFVAMAAAIAVVYLIMVLCFGNASSPFAILFSLPLAVIGGLLGLLVSGEALNVTSLIGFMMLIGIVVTNAIVLLDRAQQLMKDGYTTRDALLEAGRVRLRPIIMTASATIVAMIPLALGSSGGTLISKGLAVVVIGGLTTSTLLTLVVVPIIYEMIDNMRNRLSRSSHRKGNGIETDSLEM